MLGLLDYVDVKVSDASDFFLIKRGGEQKLRYKKVVGERGGKVKVKNQVDSRFPEEEVKMHDILTITKTHIISDDMKKQYHSKLTV